MKSDYKGGRPSESLILRLHHMDAIYQIPFTENINGC